MEENTLRELYVSELQDLYDAENQLIEALPKIAEASTSPDLREGFEAHLQQTRGHACSEEQNSSVHFRKLCGCQAQDYRG